METPNIKNVSDLIDCIREHEPNLVRYIMDFLFIPCSEDKEGKYEYIRALPEKNSNSISDKAFYDSKKIKMVIIDEKVKSIANCAFSNCSNLSFVSIPDTVLEIGKDAFSVCEKLENIKIPRSLSIINCATFAECHNLRK